VTCRTWWISGGRWGGTLRENWRFMEWTDCRIKNVFKFPKTEYNFT